LRIANKKRFKKGMEEETAEEGSQRYRYRSVGLPLRNTTDHLKIFVSPMKMPLSPEQEKKPEVIRIESEGFNDLTPNFDHIQNLFVEFEVLESKIKLKVQELDKVNREMDLLISSAVHKVRNEGCLPTPEEYDFTTEISRYSDMPSSPGSYISNTSQVEIDINDKISRLAQRDYNSPDVMKLKNISSLMMGVLNHEVMDEDGHMKLMNLNHDLKKLSSLILQDFESLVDAYANE
jgi:hypothetical protein